TEVIALFGKFNDDARATALSVLVSRKAWALQLVESVDAGKIEKTVVPTDVVRQLTAHRDERIAGPVARLWGKVEGATTGEMKAQIEKLEAVLRGGTGTPYAGKKLFTNTCAKCHTLFGQGGKVGPDLTAYQRSDVAHMLLHIVNPSAEIREGFE